MEQFDFGLGIGIDHYLMIPIVVIYYNYWYRQILMLRGNFLGVTQGILHYSWVITEQILLILQGRCDTRSHIRRFR